MTSDLEGRLHVEMKRDWIKKLFTMEAELGQAVTLAVANAMLDAVVIYASGAVGKEGTYNSLQRRADELAGGIAEKAARHQ